jgi:TonB-linked SusC/RagA family outer membrane protein
MLSAKYSLLLLTGLLLRVCSFAQQAPVQAIDSSGSADHLLVGTVKGYVGDEITGLPLSGAMISYGDVSSAITDSLGDFSIRVPDYRVTLRIVMPGYRPREVALKGRKIVRFTLSQSEEPSYYDQVVLPYRSVPESHTTFAVSSVANTDRWSDPAQAPGDYLQGKVPGLQVIRRSGIPGIGANLYLRGFTSLYATNQPLIVVDGVIYNTGSLGNSLVSGFYQNPLAFIDTRDIDHVTVIRDASGLYGSKGANGAILITTSRAKEEVTHIDFGSYGAVNLEPQFVPVMNARDYRIYLSGLLQTGPDGSYDKLQHSAFMNDDKSSPDYYQFHGNTNWQRAVFRNSFTQNDYLRITGGDNIAKYALSIGYLNDEGTLKNTGLVRYSTRFNTDLNISKRLKVSANFSFADEENKLKNTGTDVKTNPIYAALVKAPFLSSHQLSDQGVASPVLAPADSFGVSNPTALIQGMQAASRGYSFMGSADFTYTFNNHFSASALFAVTMDKVRESFFVPHLGIVTDTLADAIAENSAGAQVLRRYDSYGDFRLSYHKNIRDIEDLVLNLGVRYLGSQSEGDFGLGSNTPTDQYVDVQYGNKNLQQIGGSLGGSKWMETYFNTAYNYLDKYFLTLNVSVDGSSRFGGSAAGGAVVHAAGENYPVFPSLSAAWLVSSEDFMARYPWIDLLKIRASAGTSGNDDIGDFASGRYYVSQNLLSAEGLVRGSFNNPALQWEAVRKLDAGLDVSVLDEVLSLTLDVYSHRTSHMLVWAPAPAPSGMKYQLTNSGSMKTGGWEAGLNARVIRTANLKWSLGFNISHYRNTVTSLPAGDIVTGYAGGSYITRVGSAPNLFYGYQTRGVYATQAEASSAGLKSKNADGAYTAFSAGDMRFVDQNGDGIIDAKDQTVIGDPNPRYVGAVTSRLSWKDWSLNALFTWSEGGDLYNYMRRQLESMSGYANQTLAVVNSWRTEGQKTAMPRAAWGDPAGNSRFSDRWIEDGSYLRLRSLCLSYDVPVRSRVLRYISLYATGTNLFTLSRYLGYDPEFNPTASVFGQGTDIITVPQYRSVQLGVRLGL